MKRTFLFFFIALLFPVFVVAQLKQEIGLSSSWRQINNAENQINLTGEYRIHWSKLTAGLGLGAECWYIYSPNATNPNILMQPSFTGKVEPWIGFETNLFHSGVFISANVGARFYFLNQLKDSLSLNSGDENNPVLSSSSRKFIENSPAYLYGHPNKTAANYVTKMPIAFLTRVNIGYAFKHVKISAFVMPYWVSFYFVNAVNPVRKGKTFLFFYDLGLGINYTLPFKKKEAKISGDGE